MSNQVTESPRTKDNQTERLEPYQIDPEMAKAKIAGDTIKLLGRPSVVSKKFVVRHGIFKGLNHAKDNPTGYDCSLRVAIYDNVADQSVNVDGKLFEKVFTYFSTPKIVMQGLPYGPGGFEEEKESALGRFVGWVTGKKKEGTTNGNGSN
jgi:hypothetical protein